MRGRNYIVSKRRYEKRTNKKQPHDYAGGPIRASHSMAIYEWHGRPGSGSVRAILLGFRSSRSSRKRPILTTDKSDFRAALTNSD
jgi:hypothetical protein